MTHWYRGVVRDIVSETTTVKRFFIEIPEVQHFEFEAGQFVTFDLPIGNKRNQRWRSYSIANAPDNSNVIELCIVHLPNGAASTYFFETLEIGSELKFKGPDGNFCLSENDNSDLVMICTGTGIAPFRSMIAKMARDKFDRRVHLIFGCRTSSDILYKEELQSLMHSNSLFTFDICLSMESAVGCNSGYVHQIYLEKYSGKTKGKRFYICGWSKMIDEAVENLLVKMNCDRTQIVYELYG